jgi:hypothetical protein
MFLHVLYCKQFSVYYVLPFQSVLTRDTWNCLCDPRIINTVQIEQWIAWDEMDPLKCLHASGHDHMTALTRLCHATPRPAVTVQLLTRTDRALRQQRDRYCLLMLHETNKKQTVDEVGDGCSTSLHREIVQRWDRSQTEERTGVGTRGGYQRQ